MKKELLDPRSFIRFWFFEYKNLKMKPNGTFDGNSGSILATICLDYNELLMAELIKNPQYDAETGKKIRYKALTDKQLAWAWEDFKPLAQKEATLKIFNTLKFKHEDCSELEKWLKATIGEYTPFQLAVMKHFLWQVKRKVFGKKVTYHLAPCFWGRQGGGKTEAIKKLIAPISELTMEWGINEAVDARNTKSLSENYVCLFDEMAGLQRVEIEALKRIISAEHTSYRPMRTNDMITVKQNCTFVGISNKSLSENIYDPTGLRRFVELRCLEKLDWNTINSIDSLKIWQGIDENNDNIFLQDFKHEMASHQEELRVQDEMEHFVADTLLAPTPETAKEIVATPLYMYYKFWRQNNGYSASPPLSQNLFGRKLRSYGIIKREKRVDGKDKVIYLINSNSDVFKADVINTNAASEKLEFKQ